MKFADYSYQRPDFQTYQDTYTQALHALKEASSLSSAKEAVDTLNQLRGTIDTAANLASIRYSIDTDDHFYEAEDDFWNDYQPHFEALDFQFYQALLSSPLLNELKELYPETLFLFAESRVKLFDESLISLFQKENQLVSDYGKLIASAQIDFQGQTYTLAQLRPFTENKDRQIRLAAFEKQTAFFADHESQFDQIYDDMVKVRTEIAQKLGFKNYVEFADTQMNRWDYDRKMIETYRQEILEKVVPITQKLYQRQAERNQLEHATYVDLPLVYPTGNATPKGTPEELVEKARIMYQELSPETGEFFDFMVTHDLLDLLSKTGKQSGGYCTFIQEYQSPFIFANFNGTSGDVDVLTHEAGHAFQAFSSRWIKEPEILFPNFESCEIHSMSMEFIAWPWMESFFEEETDKYKFAHLASSLQFLPYGVLVDHFQQEVYTHPEWTAAQRKQCWRTLEKQYCPERDYAEMPDLERGLYWFRQGHIFQSPFYYIDYTLAQVCAFQFWYRFIVAKDETAWQDYLAICQVGGTKTFLEILSLAHLRSPFEKGALDDTLSAVDQFLANIPESQLA
ncbi:M3 family oligoendopeptidase [Enterococcus sp. RIT-PI-f]|uniref:M3 family oligoendopeptidase n=1 Tax=Enterococcus sp. RIT-PI-f TaxID=1690244 RepID=UPI0006B9D214|nr:M3 family oligoendopeptidase [Enterococcus sp. RIT-PI-f]KPG72984.1 peptidase [Enterococcus sp. RIT-PI-f]